MAKTNSDTGIEAYGGETDYSDYREGTRGTNYNIILEDPDIKKILKGNNLRQAATEEFIRSVHSQFNFLKSDLSRSESPNNAPYSIKVEPYNVQNKNGGISSRKHQLFSAHLRFLCAEIKDADLEEGEKITLDLSDCTFGLATLKASMNENDGFLQDEVKGRISELILPKTADFTKSITGKAAPQARIDQIANDCEDKGLTISQPRIPSRSPSPSRGAKRMEGMPAQEQSPPR